MPRPRLPLLCGMLLGLGLALGGCRDQKPWDLDDATWQRALSAADQRTAQTTTPVQPGTLAQQAGDVPATQPGMPLNLSVEQAVVLALMNNRGLAAQQLGPQIAATFAQIESARFDPRLFAETSIAKQRRQEVSRATGGLFNTQAESRNIGGGIAQTLPTGTDVELGVTTTRDFSNRTTDQHETRAGLTLTQALLQGFGPQTNLVRVRQAKLDESASQYELRGFTEALVASVESTYWQAVLARQQIAIFQRAVEISRQFLDETRQRVTVGVLAESELAVAEAEIARRGQDLIDAHSRAELMRLRLLRLVNPQQRSAWSQMVELVSEPALPPPPPDTPDEHMALARMYRPDVNEARIRLQQDRLETIRTRNGLLPRLDLFLTLGKSGFADSFGDSVQNMDESAYDLEAGLRFEYPLGNRAADQLYRQSLLARQQAALAVNNLVELAELDVQLALVEAARARQQVQATAATVTLRRQALENELEKLRVGKSTNLLVAQAGRDLLESRLDEAQAIIQVKLALIDLYRFDGTLLRRRGVVAPGELPAEGAAPLVVVEETEPRR